MTEEAARWESSYTGDTAAPWDIHRPQPAFQRLAEAGRLSGAVLDCGCGTGEHTLLAAAQGARATGIDLSPTAIERARAKATDRGLDVRFEAGDILTLALPAGSFDVAVDCGLFHVFDDADRARYVTRLRDLLRPGGSGYLLCFSDRQPGDWGPRRVRADEIQAAFAAGWTVDRIDPVVMDINPIEDATEVLAWLVEVTAA